MARQTDATSQEVAGNLVHCARAAVAHDGADRVARLHTGPARKVFDVGP
jgi:hypothetical protein